jgi:antitoxin CcdA
MQDRPTTPKTSPKARRRKKSVNLSIDADLAASAKAAGANLSALLEKALRDELRLRRASAWREDNRDAIEASNRHVRKSGLPLAKFRTW